MLFRSQSGQPLLVSWLVKNSGAIRTNRDYWYDSVYLSQDTTLNTGDILLGNVYHSGALDPGSEYSASRSLDLPYDLQGSVYILVKTDSGNDIYEGSAEANNTSSSSLPTLVQLSSTPDLVIQQLDAPASATSGQKFTVNWRVLNQGGAATGSANWYEAFYLSKDQILDIGSDIYLGYSNSQVPLAPGESYSNSQMFRIPQGASGPYYLFAVTDKGSTVYERQGESNNTALDPISIDVHLSQPADLVVGDIIIPSNGVSGQIGRAHV